MNLYVRYFDNETLATNMDEVVAFLSSINEIRVDDSIIGRIINFVESEALYPFRLKVSYSNYVLFLKTEAKDLAEFKEIERLRKEQRSDSRMLMSDRKKTIMDILNESHHGWYDATLMFKRVVQNPETGKCKYVDTRFRVRLIADSAMHCYERIIDHLQNRQDVDPRSQFPSSKSNNFEYVFLDADKEATTPSETETSQPSQDSVVTPVSSPTQEPIPPSTFDTTFGSKIEVAKQGTLEFNDDASEFAS